MRRSPDYIIDKLKSPASRAWITAWGWESTVDYRIKTSAEIDGFPGITIHDFDSEVRVTKQQFLDLKNRVEAHIGHRLNTKPGGSPLLSTIAINQLRQWNPDLHLPYPAFWGIYPETLRHSVDKEDWGDALVYGIPSDSIQGTLCIENHVMSSKKMFSVFKGRQLNRNYLILLRRSIEKISTDHAQNNIVFGLGGLNKSHPEKLRTLLSVFRRKCKGNHILYIATNSFLPILSRARYDDLMQDYYEVLAQADFVSASSEEICQLGDWAGFDTKRGNLYAIMQKLALPGFTICHHRCGSAFSPGSRIRLTGDGKDRVRDVLDLATRSVMWYLKDGHSRLEQIPDVTDDMISAELYEETFGIQATDRHAAPAPSIPHGESSSYLTGLGSRFDGYLSALLPAVWPDTRRSP